MARAVAFWPVYLVIWSRVASGPVLIRCLPRSLGVVELASPNYVAGSASEIQRRPDSSWQDVVG